MIGFHGHMAVTKDQGGPAFCHCLSTPILEHSFPQHPQLEAHPKKRILFYFQSFYHILIVEGNAFYSDIFRHMCGVR